MTEQILQYFTYSADEPLLFTQIYFWVFFGVVLLFYNFCHKHLASRNTYLFLVSLFFYYKTSGFYFFILVISTLVDYLIGNRIYRSKSPMGKRWWLALSITVNLFILTYFKYAYFFADFFTQATGIEVEVFNYFSWQFNQFAGTDFVWERILLPVGISFFTFQTMSYAIDIYRGHVKPVKNFLDFGFYVSFFPQLVAGPIVRASDFVPQLYKSYQLPKTQFGIALFWIINGLLKKLFLADYVALNLVDRVFANPGSFSGFENLMALFGYTLQVYADFSGYTDIAIGVALLLGFHLPMNFNSPYKATSVGDFWRRWHMSLSSWLKDYLYIPMGGNRSGSLFSNIMIGVIVLFVSILAGSYVVPALIACGFVLLFLVGRAIPMFNRWLSTNINLMLTMLIGGLWHGASWNFVVWGGLNGIGLVVYKLWKKVSPWENRSKWYNRAIGIFTTLVFITFTRTWFRGESWAQSQTMLEQIAFSFQGHLVPDIVWGYRWVFGVMLLGFIIHWLPEAWKQWYRTAFVNSPWVVKVFIGLLTIVFIYQILSADLQPFIYFAF